MGREHGNSSIALLQERFRKLQKMRERRQEMKETMSETDYYEKARNLMVHPEVIYRKPAAMEFAGMTARSSFQESLSLGLDLYGGKTEQQGVKTQGFRDFWSVNPVTVSAASRVQERPDVDTSLHL